MLLKKWRIWIGLIVSAAFLYWVTRQVEDFGEVVRHLGSADYRWIVPAMAAYFVGVWIRAIRWQVLLYPIKRISVGRLFAVVAIGYMANDVLPARLGEVVRAYVLKERHGISRLSSLATIAVERMFDGAVMLVFVGIASLSMPFNDEVSAIFRIAGLVFIAAFLLLFLVVSSPALANRIARFVLAFLPESLRHKGRAPIDKILVGLASLQSVGSLATILGLSILAWSFEALMYLLIGIGFGLDIPPIGYLLTTGVINLGTMVPSSPGYIGTFEALGVLSLGFLGADSQQALSYVVVLHLALLLPITLLGFAFLWFHNLSLSRASSADGSVTKESGADA